MPHDNSVFRAAGSIVPGALAQTLKLAVFWQSRLSERRNLARLDDHLLRDIGLDPDAAANECAKPFWRD